jgi:hypothetical protein
LINPGEGKVIFGVALVQISKVYAYSLFPLWTITTLANHYGYLTSLMNLASNSRCTSAFAASTFSSDILWSFYFLDFTCGLIFSLCSITSLLTPTKLEVDQTTTSLFLSWNCTSFACSSGLISTPMEMILSSILRSSATLLKSPSALIAFLNYLEISSLGEGCTYLC